MPSFLEDKSKFSVLGLAVTDPTASNSLLNETEYDKKKLSEFGNALEEGSTYRKNNCRSCDCFQLDCSSRKSSQYVFGKSNWVLLTFDSPKHNDIGLNRLPNLHHIHWNGKILSQYDVHVCKSLFLLLFCKYLCFLKTFIAISNRYIYIYIYI